MDRFVHVDETGITYVNWRHRRTFLAWRDVSAVQSWSDGQVLVLYDANGQKTMTLKHHLIAVSHPEKHRIRKSKIPYSLAKLRPPGPFRPETGKPTSFAGNMEETL